MTLMTWKFAITPDREAPDIAQGYVLASSEEAARVLVAHQDAQVWPCPEKLWPGQPGAYTHWSFNPRGLSDLLERIENERVEMERLPVEACEPWGELLDPREFLEIIDKR